MTNKLQKLHLFFITSCLLFLFSGCASLSSHTEPPRVNIVNFSLQEATLFEQNYLVQLRILNPNTYDIPVTGLHYDIEINNRHFITGVSNQSVVVPALSSAVIEVKAVSTLFSIFRQISNLQETMEAISYRIKGRIFVKDGSAIRFNYNGEAPLARMGLDSHDNLPTP